MFFFLFFKIVLLHYKRFFFKREPHFLKKIILVTQIACFYIKIEIEPNNFRGILILHIL